MLCRERSERDISSCFAIKASALASHALNAARSPRCFIDPSSRRRPIKRILIELHVFRARRRPVARRLFTACPSAAWNSRDCSAASTHDSIARRTLGDRKLLSARATARRSRISSRHVFHAARRRDPRHSRDAISSARRSSSPNCASDAAARDHCFQQAVRWRLWNTYIARCIRASLSLSSCHVLKALWTPSPRNADAADCSWRRASACSAAKADHVFSADRTPRC